MRETIHTVQRIKNYIEFYEKKNIDGFVMHANHVNKKCLNYNNW